MPIIRSTEDLDKIRQEAKGLRAGQTSGSIQIILSMGSAAVATGGRATLQEIARMLTETGLTNVSFRQTGASGLDSWEPVLQVVRGKATPVTYGKVSPSAAKRILEEHVIGGQPVSDYFIPD